MASARTGMQRRSIWGRLAEEVSYRRTLEESARLALGTIPAGGVAMRAADSWLMERVRDAGSAWYRMRSSPARGDGSVATIARAIYAMRDTRPRGGLQGSSYRLPARLTAAALTVVLSGAALIGCGKQEPAQVEQPGAVAVSSAPMPIQPEPAPLEPAQVPGTGATLPDSTGEGSAASAQAGTVPGPAAGGVAQRQDPFVPPQTLEERVEPQRPACDPHVPYRERPELSQASLIQPPTITGTRAGADGPSTLRYRVPQGRSAGENELLSYRSERPLTITLHELTAQQRALGLRYVLSGENAELIAREGDTLTMPTGRTALRYISSEGIQVRLVGPDKGCGETYASVRIGLSYVHPALAQVPTVTRASAAIEAGEGLGADTGRGYEGFSAQRAPLLTAQHLGRERSAYRAVSEPFSWRAQRADALAHTDPLVMEAELPRAAWERPDAQRTFSLFGPRSGGVPAYLARETCVLVCTPAFPAVP